MAVDKELLHLDLYGLLGVSEKASEKEVWTAGREHSRVRRGACTGASPFPPPPTPQHRVLSAKAEGGSRGCWPRPLPSSCQWGCWPRPLPSSCQWGCWPCPLPSSCQWAPSKLEENSLMLRR
ncbi:unnamed protein product, partial [Bubo scandiacus]